MKLAIVGRQKEDIELCKNYISKHKDSFQIDEKKPDIVVSFGGDGSFLFSERKYPGIPKLIIRHNSVCKKCCELPIDLILEKLHKKEFEIEESNKIEALVHKNGKIIKKIASNDIVISNKLPYRALRFEVDVNGKKINDFFIGDGIVVATSFGSSGYFHSITKKSFEKGFGVAFNNVTESKEPLHFDNSVITLKVLRNNAYVSADNDPRMVIIQEGDEVRIKKSDEVFKIIKMKNKKFT